MPPALPPKQSLPHRRPQWIHPFRPCKRQPGYTSPVPARRYPGQYSLSRSPKPFRLKQRSNLLTDCVSMANDTKAMDCTHPGNHKTFPSGREPAVWRVYFIPGRFSGTEPGSGRDWNSSSTQQRIFIKSPETHSRFLSRGEMNSLSFKHLII